MQDQYILSEKKSTRDLKQNLVGGEREICEQYCRNNIFALRSRLRHAEAPAGQWYDEVE
jgi:hypothetical protein